MNGSEIIRDPVHGFIELKRDGLELRVLDMPAMQRLRGISQLAMTYLVYPGARHSRFEHSLGVVHLADRMARHVGLGGEDLQFIRLAALVHDWGHGPFSHVSEYIFAEVAAGREESPDGGDRRTETFHERITQDIIRHELHDSGMITDRQAEALRDILSGSEPGDDRCVPDIRRDIVSGPLDADKLDYLLRDSMYSGVRYGVFDLERMIHTFCKYSGNIERGTRLAVSHSDVHVVEQFVLAKHYMTQQVYRHRVRRITDAMLVRAVTLAIDEGNQDLRELYTYKGGKRDYIDLYLGFDDRRLIDCVSKGPDGRGRDLMRRLRDRRLLKPLTAQRSQAVDWLCDGSVPLQVPRREILRRLENQLAEAIGTEPHLVVADPVSVESPRETPKRDADPESIYLLPDREAAHASATTFHKVSQLFRHGDQLRGDNQLHIYADLPHDRWSEQERRNCKKTVEELVAGFLETVQLGHETKEAG